VSFVVVLSGDFHPGIALLTASGISDFQIVLGQNDLFLTEMAQDRLAGRTESLGETLTRSGIVCPAEASAQRAMQGKQRQRGARHIPELI
jgi:hypothetical protein